jgi:flavin reductase (DIM6/NTAB) family NADH-FMN oxidoreductase RutF
MPNLADITEDADLRRLFGLFPTGVTALGAMEDGRPVGMTASAFVAVSLNPPLVSVCIKRGSWTWRRLRGCRRIGISFLGDSHAVAARQLAQTGDNRFLGLDYQVGAEGALFLAGAPAWLDCSVEKEVEAGDHDIVLFRLYRAAAAEGISPLIFPSSTFHTLSPIARSRTAPLCPAE